MDENLKKLYESLSSRGYYTKSFDDFQQQYQDQSYQDKVFDVVQRDGLYTQDKQSFLAKYSPSGSTEVQTEELKKKAPQVSTELPSEESSSALPSKPKDEFQLAAAKMRGEFVPPTGTLEEQAKSVGATDSYMGMTVPKAKTYAGQQKEEKKAKELFNAQTKSKQDFNESLGQINQDLTSKDEEFIVPRLNYLFENYGFQFDQEGVGYDAISVKAPNGKTKTISVDMFTDKGDILASNELRDFINQNKPVIENETSQVKKYKTSEQVEQITKDINLKNEELGNSLKGLQAEMDALNAEREILKKNPEAPDFFEKASLLDQKAADIIKRNEQLSSKSAEINQNKEDIEKTVGYYTKARAEEGGIFRASYNAALKSIGSAGAGIVDYLAKIDPNVTERNVDNNIWIKKVNGKYYNLLGGEIDVDDKKGLTPEQWSKKYKESIESIRNGLVESVGAEVSKEYVEEAQKDFLKRNVIGAAGFVPILAGAAVPGLGPVLFFSTAYDGANEEMESNPAFKDLSTAEKTAVATTLGFVNAALLKYNATNKFLESAAGKSFVVSVLKKMGSQTSAKSVQEFVENEVQGGIKKGLITTLSGSAHGFTTGMELVGGELGVKTVYNLMKDEKMFEVPTGEPVAGEERKGFSIRDIDFAGYGKQIVEGGIDMAMGAAMLGSLNTIRQARKENNFNGVTDNDVAMFEAFAIDNNLRTLDVQSIKADLLKKNYDEYRKNGYTSAEAYEKSKQDIQNLNDAVGIYNSIPSDLTVAGKRKALGLLTERTELEKKIEGKDKSLTKKETDRINEINKDLEDLSTANKPTETTKPEENAIQEPTTEEGVLRTEQPQVELPTVGEGNAKGKATQEGVTPAKPKQEVETPVEFSADEIESLKADIGKIEEQGKLSENVGEKVYRGNEEGNIKIEGQQYVFESNNTIKELGNVNEVGDSFLASLGLSKFPTEGVKTETMTEGKKPNVVTIEGKEFTFLRSRKPEGGKAVIVVKDNETGLQRVIKGDGAEKVLKDISLQKPAPEIKLELKTEGKPVVEKSQEELKREARLERKKAREEAELEAAITKEQLEAKTLEELTKMQEQLDKETAQFESDLLDTIAQESSKEKKIVVKSKGQEFSVTKKADGEYSVSQKNENGRFIGIKDAKTRNRVVKLFEKAKSKKDQAKIEQAQELVGEFKKEQSDKILSALDKAVDATSTKGKAFDATLGLPLMVTNAFLRIVRAAYRGNKSLVEAIKDGHEFLKKKGYYNISEYDLKKYVLENINKQPETKGGPKAGEPKGGEPKTNAVEYEKLTKAVDADVAKSKTSDEILSRIQKTDAYKKLTDTEKENITRYVKEAFGEKTKKAPSASKLLGFLKDVKKITATEMSLLKKQLKDMATGAKGAETAIKKATAEIGAELKKMREGGKISAKQVEDILGKFSKLKVLNAVEVDKFTDYMRKVFADADYKEKLKNANDLKKSIKKASNSDNYDPHLVKLAKRFLRIDTSLVEDINEYNKMASDLKEAVKGSSTKKFASTVEIKTADAYVEEMMKTQKEKLTEMMREEIEDLLGVDGSKFTYDEMMELIKEEKVKGAEEKEKLSKENEKAVRSAAIKLFDSLSSTIDYILETGKDPFTDQEVNIKESKKALVKKFMEMDLAKMDIKDAIRAVDALNNFIVNESTAKMEDTVRKYQGNEKAINLHNLGIKSKRLRIYFNKWLGRFLGDQFATQPVLFEALFGGTKIAEYVEREMGIADLKSNKSKAQAMVNKMVSDYVIRFEKTKPNGEAFNTSSNSVERGMLAFVSRAEIGNEQKSFDNRKKLITDSIKELKSGTEEQQKKGEVYEKVYDKILKDSKNAEEVKNKADKKNAEAVDYWVEKWTENYDELADVAENIHNSILGKDLYYTPDKYSSLGPEKGLKVEKETDFDIMGSAFLQNSGNIYKTKTGRLEEAFTENKLPENRYVDLSFDSNNANLMMDAMIDIKTAGDVRQIDAFLKSDIINQIVPNAEERKILQSRIDLMVRNFRNKNHYNYDEIAKLSKSLNRIASLGASYALGGVTQPIKQIVPVAVNTMANGGIPKFSILYDKAMRDFVNNSGEAIALRGIESVSEFKAIESLIEKAAESTPEKAMQIIEKINRKYLELFLQKPDAFIAKASWITYYEKALKKQGKYETVEKRTTPSGVIEVTTKGIDYSKHEINREAAQYAQKMVDRQQNISDADLKGRVFSDKSGLSQITTKVILPFASFRINQWLRMNADLGTITSKTATKEDRAAAARSLGGFGLEVATFNAIGLGISGLTYSLATGLLRDATGSDINEDDRKKLEEKDEKYWENLMKGKGGSIIQDVFSPVPFADPLFEGAAYASLNAIQALSDIKEEDRINIFSPKPKEFFKSLGTLGIVGERTYNLYNITKALATGEIEEENFGKTTTKNIRNRDEDVLAPLATLAFLNTLGVLPTDFNTAQNTIFKEISKQASTKTESEISEDREKKKEQNEKYSTKIKELDEAISKTRDKKVIDELLQMKKETQDKINKPEVSTEEKENAKEEKEKEKAEYKELLEGYENRSELKKYNPRLYEENFGEYSDYYKAHKSEMEAEKLYNQTKKENKDELYDYTPKKKKVRNRDGTTKRVARKSFRFSSRSSSR
jgi:hypothetical protein